MPQLTNHQSQGTARNRRHCHRSCNQDKTFLLSSELQGSRDRRGPSPWGRGRAGTHLHLGHQQQLLLDAQEDRIEGQLVGLLGEPHQGGLRRRQQAVAAGAPLLGRAQRQRVRHRSGWGRRSSRVLNV